MATAVAPLAGDTDAMVGIVVSGFSATCLLLQDTIAKAGNRNTSNIQDTIHRFFMIHPFL